MPLEQDRFTGETWAATQNSLWLLESTAVIAGLRHAGIIAPFVIDGPVDGMTFLDYIDEDLDRELWPGDVVALDNLSMRKSEAVKAAMRLLAQS